MYTSRQYILFNLWFSLIFYNYFHHSNSIINHTTVYCYLRIPYSSFVLVRTVIESDFVKGHWNWILFELWNFHINCQNFMNLILYMLDFENRKHTKFRFSWPNSFRDIIFLINVLQFWNCHINCQNFMNLILYTLHFENR